MRTQPPGANSTPQRKKPFPRTDAGNAEAFVALYKDDLRYDHKRNQWLIWRRHRWVEDLEERVMQMAKRAARIRLQSAENLGEEGERTKQVQWARESEARARLEATLRLARTEYPIADAGSGWDADPLLLGVPNGVVDLRTGDLRPGERSDKITLQAGVPFDPEARAPRWERFLNEVFEGDRDTIEYVQNCAGYSLTGDVSEHCVFGCCGTGANGKSTFLDTVAFVQGDYARNLPFSAFEQAGRQAIPSEIAGLVGRRFVTAIETDELARLNEARIKALTGGDRVTARFLYSEWFTFVPTAKYWLAFNHPPQVADTSTGFWRRVRIIPFPHEFGNGEADRTLSAVLRAEAVGILAWMVRGCLKWQREDLEAPERVRLATQAYREESDPLADFLAERCLLRLDVRISATCLWEEYLSWASDNYERNPLSRRAFTRALEARGLKKARLGHERTWTWLGICRTSDAPAHQVAVGA